MQTQAQIQDKIQTFVAELDLLVRKSALEALRGVLEGSAGPARRGRRPGRPRAAGRGSANVEGAAEAIVAHVQANDGQPVSEIARATGIQLETAKRVIGKLVSTGQLKKTGEKRGTKYHVGSGNAPAAKKAKRGKRRGRKAKAA